MASVTFGNDEDNQYITIVSVNTSNEREPRGQVESAQPAETRSPPRSILSEPKSELSGQRFEKRRQTRVSQRSSSILNRRQRLPQQQQHHHHHHHKDARTQSRHSSSTRSSRGSSVSSQEKRQLSIINTTSFVVFMANLLAALAVLILFSDFATLTIGGGGGDTKKEEALLSLSIAPSCPAAGRCHKDQTINYPGGSRNPIGPLMCSNWSKDSVYCKHGIHGSFYRLVGAFKRIAVMRTGYYRIYMMVTSCSKGPDVQFGIHVNNKIWSACYPKNISKSIGSNAYTRCYANAVRYLRADTDTVDFKCSGSSDCCVNSFDRLTHFGLERLGD